MESSSQSTQSIKQSHLTENDKGYLESLLSLNFESSKYDVSTKPENIPQKVWDKLSPLSKSLITGYSYEDTDAR